MSLKVYGRACWIGQGGTLVTAELAAGKLVPVNISHGRNVPGPEVNDGDGNWFADGFGTPQDSVTVTAIISSALTPPTMSDVAANMLLPVAGAIIALTGTPAAMLNGDWNCGRTPHFIPATGDAWKVEIPLTRKGAPTVGSPNIPTAGQVVA